MTQTLAALIPLLQYLAAPGVAGYIASRLFARARRRMPLPATAPAAWWRQWLLMVLYAPFFARLSVVVLAYCIGMAAQVGIAALLGQPALPVLDAALASALAGLVSQFAHAATDLSWDVPNAATPAPMVVGDDGVGYVPGGIYEGIAARDRANEVRKNEVQ